MSNLKKIVATLLFLFTASSFADPCSLKTEILVICHKNKLLLCKDGQSLQEFEVALGRGGIYKRMSGDGKTPIGDYPLKIPRTSRNFGIFIPIGYPTPDQVLAGFTGSAIGIHGPNPYFAWFRRLKTLPNWTQGCIALRKSSEIQEIASWIKNNRPMSIRILA